MHGWFIVLVTSWHVKTQEHIDALGPLVAQIHSLESLQVAEKSWLDPLGDSLLIHTQGLSNLQKLAVNSFVLGEKGTAALAKLLQGLADLQELSLAETSMEIHERQSILQHLSCLQCLRVLDLQCTDLGDEGARDVADSFPQLSALQNLNLARNSISDRGFWYLADQMTSLKVLEDLDLSNNEFPVVAGPLPVMPSLMRLNVARIVQGTTISLLNDFPELSMNVLDDVEHFTALESLNLSPSSAQCMGVLEKIGNVLSLRTLVLFNCRNMRYGDKERLRFCLSKLHMLQKLDLRGNALYSSRELPVDLMSCVARMHQLTWLSLSAIGGYSPDGVLNLPQALESLQRFQKLHHLDVSYIRTSRRQAARAACAVGGFTSLRSLDVTKTSFLPKAVGAFMQGSNLWSLEHLNISDLVASSGKVVPPEFLPDIGNMSRLQSLCLGVNRLDAGARRSLIQSMAGLSCLSYLGLASCELKDEGVLHLLPAIAKLDALRELHVQDNGISVVGRGALIPALNRGPEVVFLYADTTFQALPECFSGPMQFVDVHITNFFQRIRSSHVQ